MAGAHVGTIGLGSLKANCRQRNGGVRSANSGTSMVENENEIVLADVSQFTSEWLGSGIRNSFKLRDQSRRNNSLL
jgi:hypothetical protein